MKSKKEIENLYDLYSDDIHRNTLEVRELSSKLANDLDKLIETLDTKQAKLLNEILEISTERESIVDKKVFVYGFSLATKLFIESLQGEG